MDRSTTSAPQPRPAADMYSQFSEHQQARTRQLAARLEQALAELDAEQADQDAFQATARAQVRRRGMHLAGGIAVEQ